MKAPATGQCGATNLGEVGQQELSRLLDGLRQRLEGQRLGALVLGDDAAALVGAAGRRLGAALEDEGKISTREELCG